MIENVISNLLGVSATVSRCVDETNNDDDKGLSDSMTTLIPIAAAAMTKNSPNE